MAANRITSALSVDFGSVNTRVVLVDVVDGEYRMVGRSATRTTAGFPVNDLAIGLDRALKELTEATGRRFADEGGRVISPERPDRSGVDYFGTTASVGRPLRAVMVGLVPSISIASAARAAVGTYVDVVTTISLEDGLDEEERLNAILLASPDVIIMTGGTESGAEMAVMELAKVVRLAISLIPHERRPQVLFAGNSRLADPLTMLFKGETGLLVADNVRPSLDVEEVESARLQLAQAFDQYKEGRNEGGFADLSDMSTTGFLPTAQSFSLLAEFIGKAYGDNVIALDVGSATTTLAAHVSGHVSTRIRSDVGMGHNIAGLLSAAGLDAVHRWLPFNAPDNELYNYVANKSLRPATVPMTQRDLYIEHALLRAVVQAMITNARETWTRVPPGPLALDTIIGAGATITDTGSARYTAMLLLDTVQPAGVTRLLSDPFGLAPALGGLAQYNPEAVVQLLEGNNLTSLGTAVSLSGTPRRDRNAMRVVITREDGHRTVKQVQGGHIWVFELPVGEKADVRIRVSGGMHVNGRRRLKLKVTGGAAGLIFDARGRSIALAKNAAGRAGQIPMWIAEATGDSLIAVPDEWLAVTQVETASEAKPEKAPKRESRRARRRRERAAAEAAALPEFDDEGVDMGDLEAEFGGSEDDDLRNLRDALS